MGPLPLDLERLQEHLGELLAELLLGAQLTPAQDNPAPLLSAFGRVFQAMSRLDAEALQQAGDTTRSATALGESAHRLLNLAAECLDGGESARGGQLAVLYVGFAYWVARHGGNPVDLPGLVEHLSRLDCDEADTGIDPVDLATVMLALIDSTAAYRRAETQPTDPRDPWRLLHLHACAVAQRTQRADVIQQAHSRLLRHLPGDVARCGKAAFNTRRARASSVQEAIPGTRPGELCRESHKPTLH